MSLLDAEVASAEHAFNVLKTVDEDQQHHVLEAPTPGENKLRGRRVALRPGWDVGGRVWAMQRAITAKFAVPALSVRLADTGDLRLVETNYWHDLLGFVQPQHEQIPGTKHARRVVDGRSRASELNRPIVTRRSPPGSLIREGFLFAEVVPL
ncbi:NADAR family protein [Kribbella qitaiheensis]|uniref:NADAR family protein n=1 Tax=Kribbella qitaiheensis TaxID=1544730 RepID=A0A7G6WVX3_9ACTN|nr:NADAR family protein [Kribbella qitaiheensis]QNE18138.1 NADAR family protein [Kribbella qitaiheensis]